MKVAILDDWFDTLRTLPSFAKLAGHDVTVFTDHVQDSETLAQRLAETEALVLIRERTPTCPEVSVTVRLAATGLPPSRGASMQ